MYRVPPFFWKSMLRERWIYLFFHGRYECSRVRIFLYSTISMQKWYYRANLQTNLAAFINARNIKFKSHKKCVDSSLIVLLCACWSQSSSWSPFSSSSKCPERMVRYSYLVLRLLCGTSGYDSGELRPHFWKLWFRKNSTSFLNASILEKFGLIFEMRIYIYAHLLYWFDSKMCIQFYAEVPQARVPRALEEGIRFKVSKFKSLLWSLSIYHTRKTHHW